MMGKCGGGVFCKIAFILIILGALNWGLIGFFGFNFFGYIFASVPMVARIVYAVVGLAGLWVLFAAMRCCGSCKKECKKD